MSTGVQWTYEYKKTRQRSVRKLQYKPFKHVRFDVARNLQRALQYNARGRTIVVRVYIRIRHNHFRHISDGPVRGPVVPIITNRK